MENFTEENYVGLKEYVMDLKVAALAFHPPPPPGFFLSKERTQQLRALLKLLVLEVEGCWKLRGWWSG